jgi:hypothetical protein
LVSVSCFREKFRALQLSTFAALSGADRTLRGHQQNGAPGPTWTCRHLRFSAAVEAIAVGECDQFRPDPSGRVMVVMGAVMIVLRLVTRGAVLV